ncbi:TonB family protein [Trinickia caryophylli]|uniref:Outer membrane transport energization protein TonB n=1 Tax=Trinickia caryophylli TaxID=28094 RepID=A0A1X7H4T7_TRICW|nr:TonB family protein [Trinickia caryophylli]PMS09620.1 energy transducer TonB [Trinickia caryophylli]TRX17243.1 TonB family protein [Trinickia caryophylli]WQE12022.1 TonB family protein [Trinickia caryophylli]SMF79787.1 outer membrane transport energization protein TonB [Trinickia caryophylli]GLU35585.1 hypothetical protein Busp01_54270 [Trinickia caryophylli]
METPFDNGYDNPDTARASRWIKRAALLAVLIAVAWLMRHFAGDQAGVKRAQAPMVTTVIPLPPPPPPPPPQQKPPEKVEQQTKAPVERPTEVPKPAQSPKPADNTPRQLTMNAPAQAGTDGFNIGAGDGTGMAGSGGAGAFGNATYRQYMAYLLQQAVERDKRVQQAGGGSRFDVNLNVWMEPSGRIVKVAIARSTGDTALDDAIASAIQAIGRMDEAPPPNATYPVLVKLQGRKTGL